MGVVRQLGAQAWRRGAQRLHRQSEVRQDLPVYQILNHRGPDFFGLDWKPQPAANVYVLSVFMRAANSIVALRLPAALYSVAALLPFYLLARAAPRLTALLLATGLLLSLMRLRDTWQWWLRFLVPFFATQALTIGIWRRCAARSRALAAAYWLAVALLSGWSVTQYFAWARSPALLSWLEPSIPVEEFPRWRAAIVDWTAQHDGFINLDAWRQQSLPGVPEDLRGDDTD